MFKKIKSFLKVDKDWKDIEYFHDQWKERIAFMAQYIPEGSSVMDLGCGQRWLIHYLPANCTYYPVDYNKRSDDTIVANFNKKEFPEISADTIFISGSLEYIHDYEWFISSACKNSKRIIISYCTTEDFPDLQERRSLAWVNQLSKPAIISLFKKENFLLTIFGQTETKNSIFVFDINEKKRLHNNT